jgi:hypothetical protein
MLQALLRCAARRLSAGMEKSQVCDWAAAAEEAELSWRLRNSRNAAQLAFAAAAALGDCRRALIWHARAKRQH